MPITTQCAEAGKATRFQKGQFTREKSPKWKGGYYFLKYGITYEDYDRMLLQQNGVCAICGTPPKKNRLAVDHCHKTKKVRGLLCFRCNYGLNWFQDNPERFTRASAYLKGELLCH
jgi:hypothetical protein